MYPRPQLPRRGSSQISDLDLESDVNCPPTPVLEGRHMAPRELPFDLEKCQKKENLGQKTAAAVTQEYKSYPYPSYTPPECALPPSHPAHTKEFLRTGTFYFVLRECFYFPYTMNCLLTLLNLLETLLWWFIFAAVLASTSRFDTHPNADFDGEELEVNIPWWYVTIVLTSLSATYHLTTWGAKRVMDRFGVQTSGIWFGIYSVLPVALAVLACCLVHFG